MAAKDPKRWQEVIIDAPFARLTKQEVYDYYSTPKIQKAILDAVGHREAVIRQSFAPGQNVLRRKDERGSFVRLDKGRLDLWNEKRLSEVHPTFGKTVDKLFADIDPQEDVPWQRTKQITETVAKAMSSRPDVKDVKVRFSGGRGFYVEGKLDAPIGVDHARNLTQQILHGVAQRPDCTLGVAKPGMVRLDTTPLKVRGSVRAPYSLNASTGLVSAPVKIEELPNVKKEDFTIAEILRKKTAQTAPVTESLTSSPASVAAAQRQAFGVTKRQLANSIPVGTQQVPGSAGEAQNALLVKVSKEFAPGIPKARKIRGIPTVTKPQKNWTLAIQTHKADIAGEHYDLRLVPPKGNKAHSWAIPKARLPEAADKMLLAIQQPTHTKHYATTFSGKIPKGTYGAGTVELHTNESVKVLSAGQKKIKFQRPNGDQYALFRMGAGKNWGIKKINPKPVQAKGIIGKWRVKTRQLKVDKRKKRATAFIRDHMRVG